MAENDKSNDTQTTQTQATEQQDLQSDYNKQIHQKPTGTSVGDGMSTGSDNSMRTDRDRGRVGGGTIPGGANTGSGKSPGGRNTSNSTVEGGGTMGGGNIGGGESSGRGRTTNQGISQNSGNVIDDHVQTNTAGRHPTEPERLLGDQDPQKSLSKERPDIADPITSRDPKAGKEQSMTENNP